MEALQVRQRSSDFDRISNELSLLEWEEWYNREESGSRRQGGWREWRAGRRLLTLPSQLWLVGGMDSKTYSQETIKEEVTSRGKITGKWNNSNVLKSSAIFSEPSTRIQGWQICVYSWNNWEWITEDTPENETYEKQNTWPGREQRLIKLGKDMKRELSNPVFF